MKKVLVTGIDGFIGTAIAEKLSLDGHVVVGMSIGSGPGGSLPFHHVNVTDRAAVIGLFGELRPDLCIHLAAMAHADVGPEKEQLVRRVNHQGSLNVADAAEAVGSELIFFSSAKVLADTTERAGIDEESVPKPVGVYASLKREIEVELLERAERGRLATAVVRPAAVIGTGDAKGNYAKVIRAVRRGFFPLIDGGRVRRSIVFRDRLAERIRMMTSTGISPGQVLTLSDGAFELREIVDAIRTSTGYAWCPSIPRGALETTARAGDALWSALSSDSEPLGKSFRRLTADFVIRTHLFDERYGALPPMDLLSEMARVCGVVEGPL